MNLRVTPTCLHTHTQHAHLQSCEMQRLCFNPRACVALCTISVGAIRAVPIGPVGSIGVVVCGRCRSSRCSSGSREPRTRMGIWVMDDLAISSKHNRNLYKVRACLRIARKLQSLKCLVGTGTSIQSAAAHFLEHAAEKKKKKHLANFWLIAKPLVAINRIVFMATVTHAMF